MKSLIDDNKVILASGSQTTYRFDTSISYVGVRVMCASDLYMVSALGSDVTNASGEAVFTLNRGDEQHIQIDKNSETLTVTWAYDSDSFGADAYLEHGKAQITAIEGVSDFSTLFGGNPGDAKGGNIAVPAGKKVTIKLVPDYGYQVAGLQLNGGVTLQPDDAQTSTFTFVMGNNSNIIDSKIHLLSQNVYKNPTKESLEKIKTELMPYYPSYKEFKYSFLNIGFSNKNKKYKN